MSEKINKKIAERIAARLAILKEDGRGQAWVAEKIGVSVNAVSKWKKTGKISRENVPAVAELLGMSVDELIGDQNVIGAVRLAETKLERLDPSEALLVEYFRECEEGEQKIILNHAKLLAEAKAQNKTLFPGRNKPQ